MSLTISIQIQEFLKLGLTMSSQYTERPSNKRRLQEKLLEEKFLGPYPE